MIAAEKKPIDLGNRIHLIDLYDLGWEERTGSYIINEENLTIVETCASPSIPYLLKGLRDLGHHPHDVKYIIVTHIHLDHAGGAGLLLQECPNAAVVVHPKGANHLVKPDRLIAGAKQVYGEKFDQLFSPIIPIPEEKIIIKGHGETLAIGSDCTLTFYDTPGHANHHFSIYDPISNGMFTGDTVGIQYFQVKDYGISFYLPTTSPNQFNPNLMLQSMKLYEEMKLDRIYFGHFGMSTNVSEVYQQMKQWLPIFVDTATSIVNEGKEQSFIVASLFQQVQDHLVSKGIPENHHVFEVLKLDLEVCVMGLVDYLHKNRK